MRQTKYTFSSNLHVIFDLLFCGCLVIVWGFRFTQADSNIKSYNTYGVSFAEVEVDVLTGETDLRRVDLLVDTGKSMSPEIDIGQIEGAYLMGLGYHLTEDVVFSRQDGALLTNRTWNYHPPTMKDIPTDWRVSFRKNSSNQNGVLRSKS